MIDSVKLGKLLKEKRKSLNLSQEIVSSFADIGRTHLSAIERGERRPALDTFVKIAYALKTTPNKLMKEVEDKIINE